MFSPNLYPQTTKIIGIVKGEETWLNLGGCTVKSHFIDFINTRLIQAPNYYGQFALFLRKESPYIFLKFNRLILFIFIFIRFANYWQGHRNSMMPITASL